MKMKFFVQRDPKRIRRPMREPLVKISQKHSLIEFRLYFQVYRREYVQTMKGNEKGWKRQKALTL